MAWEISITQEGWGELYDACHLMERDELIDALADDYWEKHAHKGFANDFNRRFFEYAYIMVKFAPQDALADAAFDLIAENNTCDNGGFTYWIDREGYHTVQLPPGPH